MNIFDPLSVIIKLGILSKKPIGTKISIKNYIIEIQEISSYQGFIRYFNGDNKYDLINIIYPIKLACELYLSNKNITNIKLLFRNAQNGIYMLIKLYEKYSIILYSLKYANMIIDNYINNLTRDELIFKYKSNILLLHDQIIILKKSLSCNSLNNINLNNSTKSISRCSSNNIINENQQKFFRSSSINSINDSSKILSKCSSINGSPQSHSGESTINDIIYRYGATGFFSFDDINENQKEDIIDSKKICDEIIENINSFNNYYSLVVNNNILIYDINNNYNTHLLNNLNELWTIENINNIIINMNNYINSKKLKKKHIIEIYMEDIDDNIINIILQ